MGSNQGSVVNLGQIPLSENKKLCQDSLLRLRLILLNANKTRK